jgi:putative ABC transport system permease protein
MSFRDLIRETFSALNANRGRSFLTILGIVIGIAAVIAMTSLIGGIREALVSELGLDQSRTVYISANVNRKITDEDVEQIEQNVSGYDFVTGVCYYSGTISSDTETASSSTLLCVDPEYFQASAIKLVEGRTFTETEDQQGSTVIILDKSVAQDLFGGDGTGATGQSVKIGGNDYTVIGITESVGGFSSMSYIPLQTAKTRILGSDYGLSQIIGFASENANVDDLAENTKSYLTSYFGTSATSSDNAINVTTMESVSNELNTMMSAFELMMTAVAGISLLVGGIGIMNMMLTNVTERIREIGLRKALGARSSDITKQFLMESVTLCLVGGVIGVILGYIGAWGLASLASSMTSSMSISPVISPTAIAGATGISLFIGVAFGYYPARRAAKLNPVESLRFQ